MSTLLLARARKTTEHRRKDALGIEVATVASIRTAWRTWCQKSLNEALARPRARRSDHGLVQSSRPSSMSMNRLRSSFDNARSVTNSAE